MWNVILGCWHCRPSAYNIGRFLNSNQYQGWPRQAPASCTFCRVEGKSLQSIDMQVGKSTWMVIKKIVKKLPSRDENRIIYIYLRCIHNLHQWSTLIRFLANKGNPKQALICLIFRLWYVKLWILFSIIPSFSVH